MMGKKIRLYVDEVGNPGLKNSDLLENRFLSLTGIAFCLDFVSEILFPELEELKRTYFLSHPDDPVILHRKEIVYRKPPFSVLKDPEVERSFNSDLLNKLGSWNYSVISVIIDKQEHNKRYATWKFDPYHYCMEILVERFRLLLDISGARGDMMFESRGGKEDTRLKRSYRRIMEGGTHHIDKNDLLSHFTSKELKVRPKTANIAGLQVADLIAHPARRWFFKNVFHMNENRNTFSDTIIEILDREKFFRYNGVIIGYGAKKLP